MGARRKALVACVACCVAGVVGFVLVAGGAAVGSVKPTLTIASPLACLAIDPTDVGGSQFYDNVLGIAYESLIRQQGNGDLYRGPYEPGLARSWRLSDHNTVITLTLRTTRASRTARCSMPWRRRGGWTMPTTRAGRPPS